MLRRRRAAPNTDFGDTTSFSGYVSDSAMTVVWVPSLTTDSGYWAIGSVRKDSKIIRIARGSIRTSDKSESDFLILGSNRSITRAHREPRGRDAQRKKNY